jgi:sec-independent protein translocase protein TatA
MFGIGMPELLVVLAIALIVFGPGKIPELGNSLGKAIRNFKKAVNETDKTSDEMAGKDKQ